MLFEVPSWVSTLIAAIAVCLSAFSLRYSRTAVGLAVAQEQRRKPDLSVEYQDGYISRNDVTGPSTYLFLVKIINRSDSNTSVVEARMDVTYRLGASVPVAASVPHNCLSGPGVGNSSHLPLDLPVRVDARQAVFGWVCFSLTPELADRQQAFQSYRVSVVDSLQNATSFQPVLLSVRR